MIEGSFQWITDRKIIRRCNMMNIGKHSLDLPNIPPADSIAMIDHEMYSHISIDCFTSSDPHLQCMSSSKATLNAPLSSMAVTTHTSKARKELVATWSSILPLVDRVNRHVCGHSTYTDMQTLFVRNGLWTV